MRLTERVIDDNGVEHIFTKYVKDNGKLKDKKLCALEDIEDEFGIDLITLFKALKSGIYVKSKIHGDAIRFIPPDCLVFDSEYLYELKFCKGYTKLKNNVYPFEFKDYGETWALTKEELL